MVILCVFAPKRIERVQICGLRRPPPFGSWACEAYVRRDAKRAAAEGGEPGGHAGKKKRSGGLAPEGRRGRAKRARDPQAGRKKVRGLFILCLSPEHSRLCLGVLSGTTFLTPGGTKIFRVGGSKYLHLHAV